MVHLEVEPWSNEVKAVPSLYAVGPLRGDNFVRFAIHDGHGVAAAIRDAKAARGEPEACS